VHRLNIIFLHLGRSELAAQCKACLGCVQAGDSVIPRLEVLEHCALALLNLGDWEYLTGLDRRWSYSELPVAIAHACQDIAKYKGNKKVSRRDAWELSKLLLFCHSLKIC
jgi:integrator complex subunit 8